MQNSSSKKIKVPKKKVLVITYYWYPYADVGTYRISRFCKYLAKRGWEISILTAKKASSGFKGKPDYPALENIRVYRSHIFEPTKLLNIGKKNKIKTNNPSVFYQKDKNFLSKIAVWLRLNVMIPDAKFTWKWFAVRLGKKIIEDIKPDIIFSTSPPPTTSLIAKELADWSNIPWLADFRDPWTNIYYYDEHPQSKYAQKKNKKIEFDTLKRADQITVVNEGFFPEYEKVLKSKTTKIPNGFDPDHTVNTSNSNDQSEIFTIRYFGSLKANQDPGALFQALNTLEKNHPEIVKAMRIEFYGSIDASIHQQFIKATKVIEVSFNDFISHSEMMKKISTTSLLLFVIGRSKNSKMAFSTKVFEYMLSNNPIIGIGPIDGAAAELIQKTNTGKFFDRTNNNGMLNYILEVYNANRNGTKILEPNKEAVLKYNFKVLTDQLENKLIHLIEKT